MIKPFKNKYKKQDKTQEWSSKSSLVGLFFNLISKKPSLALQRIPESKVKIRKLVVFLALLLMPFWFPSSTNASLQDELNEVNKKIEETKKELSTIQQQRDTLESQISAFNSQISSIEYQISLTDQKIALLNKQIEALNEEIKQAEEELEIAKSQLADLIKAIYEDGQISAIEMVANADSFSDLLNKTEYLEQVQSKIHETANEIIELKEKLESKKKEVEENKKEAEKLREEQASQKAGLVKQKSAKDSLLEATKGNEAEYQSLLKKLKEEQQRIQNEIWYGGNYVSYGTVKAGDIIGRIGNSGYSTGCHLHFEIRTSGKSTVNPANYIGNGYFIHPVPGVPISAPYGYSSYYFPGFFHSGIDYADGCAGTPIRAAADGEIIKKVTGKPNTYPWSYEYGNYVMIRHTNGMYSLYGHMR